MYKHLLLSYMYARIARLPTPSTGTLYIFTHLVMVSMAIG